MMTDEEFEVAPERFSADKLDEVFTQQFIEQQVITDEARQAIERIVVQYVRPMTNRLSDFAISLAYQSYLRSGNPKVSLEEFEEAYEESDTQMELLSSYIGLEGLKNIENYWFVPFMDDLR